MKRLILSIVLAAICSISSFAYNFSAMSESGHTLYYTITSSSSPYTVEVVSQNTYSPYYTTYPTGNLTIPSSVTNNSKTYSVTSIGDYAFYGCSRLTSVTIGNSVTSIADNAFYGCSRLTTVNFNATSCTSMGNSSYSVFSGCTSLSTLNIGSNVKNIPDYAFYGCSGLTSVTIPNSVRSIGNYAFKNCSGLTSVNFNATNCTSMGNSSYPVFSGCTSLSTLNIGSNVTNIPDYAFYGCSGLTGTLTIPNSVTNIGSYAFYNCSGLTEPVYNASWFAYIPIGYATEYTIPNGIQHIAGGAFYNRSELTSVTIPNSVTSIGNSAFQDCGGLTGDLTIPNSVTSIGDSAFQDCGGLTGNLTIPNSVTSIGNSAFKNCGGLTGNLTIPNSVTSISNSAFQNCSGFTSVSLGNSVTSIGNSAFQDCGGLTGDLTIPNSVTRIGNSAFQNCSGFTSVSLGSSVTSIGDYAFRYCGGLTGGLTIPNSVTSIGNSAFYNCSGLTSVIIGNHVRTIGGSAFTNCRLFTSVTIPNSVTRIGGSAFSGCSGLVEITIPFVGADINASNGGHFGLIFGTSNYTGGTQVDGDYYIPSNLRSVTITKATFIPSYAFSGCSMLTSITLPNTLREIDWMAFGSCSGLTEMIIPNSVREIGREAFSGCSGLTSVTIGTSVASIGSRAFEGCTELTAVYYTGNIAGWGSIAFDNNYYWKDANPLYYAHNLYINNELVTNLIIPDPVSEITPYAFYGATCLTSVTIPNTVTSIGEQAFGECDNIVDMTIPFVGGNINATEASDTTLFGFIFKYVYTRDYNNQPISQPEGTIRQLSSTSSSLYVYIPSALRSVTVTGGNLMYGAFSNCSMLTSVTIPNSVTSIGEKAFYNCSGLTGELIIPNSVTSIGGYAFYNCSGLAWVTIGNSVTSIAGYAFQNCSGLTTVNFNATNCTTMGSSSSPVFSGCTSLTTLNIGDNVTTIPANAFYGCSGLTSVTIPNSVTSIGVNAFRGCSNLVDMTIPFVGGSATATEASASTLFGYIFGYSTPSSSSQPAGTIKQYYAYNSTSYIYAYIPSSLRSVTVTGGNLWYGAFYNCYMLTSVTIGENVTSIGERAFYNCNGLTDIYAKPTTPPTNSGSSRYSATLWVPCGSADTYRAATNWSRFSDIRESGWYMLNVSSANRQQGTANVTQQPDCTDGIAIIEAIPNRGYAFSQWNDGNTDNPRTITITEDVEYTAYFVALPSYTITVLSADETMGTVDGGGIYYEGETATLTATPLDGYGFVSWDDGSTDTLRTFVVTEDAIYTATFGAMRIIAVHSNDETMGTASGSGSYAEGTEVEISATPTEHYHFVQWNDGNTDNPRTITVTGDATYTATFTIDQHTITVESADASMGTVSESGTYDYGTEIQISATANEGYGFASWNDGNTDNPRTITVTEDATYTATFGIMYTITVLSADETMGTVIGDGEYVEGAVVQITAVPNEHYHFVHWIVEENPTRDIITDNPLTITITGDVTYTAVFAIDQHTITVESANASMGTVSEGGTYDYGTEIQISATANEHYHFVQWNDENTDDPRTITVTSDSTFTATFAIDQHTITVESADASMGTVSESGTYDYGTEIQISATANEHYHFVQWNDGNTDNPRTITVTGDATYIATFAPNNYTIVVRSLNEDWGTVSEGGTFPYGTEIQISATPRENYAFVAWTDGNTENPRTIRVVADAEYVAAFTWSAGIEGNAVSEIALFPNPATDILNITSSETISEIEIVNTLGQVVKRIEVNSDNAFCDVEDLKAGVYVVRIRTEGAVVSQRKFIKE